MGASNQDQLFYYFVESENKPGEDPLVLWLTGGPGCSALSSIAYEIGIDTLIITYDKQQLYSFEVRSSLVYKILCLRSLEF